MANNRMWMVHKPTGDKFLLCKYYPSPTWYMYSDEEKFNQFLNDHSEQSQWGNMDFVLEYEMQDLPSNKSEDGK